MVYDRVMRNIQNRQKCIKQMNSFINARFQRKLRIFAENPISGPGSRVSCSTFRVLGLRSRVSPVSWSRVSSLGYHCYGPGSRVSGPTYELDPGSRVLGPSNTLWSQVPLFGYAVRSSHRRCSMRKVFLNISELPQKITSTGLSF